MSDNVKTSNFQIIVLVVCVVAFIFAMLSFSGLIKLPGSSDAGTTEISGSIVVWGTVPRDGFTRIIDDLGLKYKELSLSYVQKDARTYDNELINAFASQTAPDIFLMTSDMILKYQDKVFNIPYVSYPLATFQQNFVQAGELFTDKKGVIAFPILLDPMVMYYNRSILDAAGIPRPPAYWDEVNALTPKIVQKDNAGNVTKSIVSFGQFSNVNHAKDLVAMLLMQLGNGIVDASGAKPASVLGAGGSGEQALSFFTQFSNPVGSSYSWNKAMPNSRDAFVSGDLAFYFGYASELPVIQEQNPNLNFNVASVPQIRGYGKATMAQISAAAISKTSKNPAAAYTVAQQFTDPAVNTALAYASGLPPVRRDLIAKKPATPAYASVFYDSALVARSWLDPSRTETNTIFKDLIENIVSNRFSVNEAVSKASNEINFLLQ